MKLQPDKQKTKANKERNTGRAGIFNAKKLKEESEDVTLAMYYSN
jgi:hypothetical protein